jgi:hypothetical protein
LGNIQDSANHGLRRAREIGHPKQFDEILQFSE